jgi:hypothetical protein
MFGEAYEFFGLPPSSLVGNNETLQQASAHPCSSGWDRGRCGCSNTPAQNFWRMRFHFILYRNIILSRRKKKVGILVWIWFMNTTRKLGLHAQTLGAALNRGDQADARGTKQVLKVRSGCFATSNMSSSLAS